MLTGRRSRASAHEGLQVLTNADIARLSCGAAEIAIRARAQTVPVSDGLVLARVLGQYKMLLSQADRGFACHVMLDGYWEIWLTKFLATRMRRGMRVVDIGANFGYYTLLMGGAVGGEGQVIAVEPNPATADVLRQTVLLNGMQGRVEVHETALGAREGETVTLFTPKGEPKNSLVIDAPADGVDFVTVTSTVLSTLTGARRIDVVKIDAEGAEDRILDGMLGILRRDRPLLVLEFNAGRYADPHAVLAQVLPIYGRMGALGFDGVVRPVDQEALATRSVGEDWILIFEK